MLVAIILKHNANPNVQEYQFYHTALHSAAYHKSARIVKDLLDHGANVNVYSKHGDSPLHGTIIDVEGSTPEILEVVSLLLQNGVNVNATNQEGLTALHMAFHSPDLVAKILDYCPDINIQDCEGRTAIHMALTSNLPVSTVKETVTMILERGKNINFSLEHKGLTILETAKKNRFKKIERMILKKMCPNPKISDSIYPLKYLL